MSAAIDNVLGRLDAKATGRDSWLARCPAHEDRNPSLSVGVGDDGRVLLNCHAGCSTGEIVVALGLGLADLFAGRSNGSEPGTGKPKKRSSTKRPPDSLPTEVEVAEWQQALLSNGASLEKARSLKGAIELHWRSWASVLTMVTFASRSATRVVSSSTSSSTRPPPRTERPNPSRYEGDPAGCSRRGERGCLRGLADGGRARRRECCDARHPSRRGSGRKRLASRVRRPVRGEAGGDLLRL